MKKTTAIVLVLAVVFASLMSVSRVEARGRFGSHRVGGYNSHGKGSHYIGGYVRTGPALRHR